MKLSSNSAFKPWKPPVIEYIISDIELFDLIEESKLKYPINYQDFIEWIKNLSIKNINGKLKLIVQV
jgi:hypothetical protein